MKKHLRSISLMLALVLGLLSGCGTPENSAASAASTASAESAAPAETTPEPAAPEEDAEASAQETSMQEPDSAAHQR